MEPTSIDLLWVSICTGLVCLMQAGFLCLEAGFTRSKNNINVAAKNIIDIGTSIFIFWFVGFGLMFGVSQAGIIGISDFALDLGTNSWLGIFFIFQAMFCGTAVTILSGAIAERVRFEAYLVIAVLVSVLIYPILGHWAWNGANLGESIGWLGALGFVDFAGSTVVHSVGGWVALAILIIIGPRIGRYDSEGNVRQLSHSNLPLTSLGILLLWVGWFGFNGGSALAFNENIGRILANTAIGGATGLISATILIRLRESKVEVAWIFNGCLAGLVAVTAGAHVLTTPLAALVGGVGAIFMIFADQQLIKWQIDDAVGAIPVHLVAGIWGTFAVGIFAPLDALATGLTRPEQIVVQLLGILTAFAWAFGVSFLLLSIIDRLVSLTCHGRTRTRRLNVSEHGATTEMLDLFHVMDEQALTGNLSLRVPIEPFTQVGQIAHRYNLVVASLEGAVNQTKAIVNTAEEGIITFDATALTINTANPAAERLLGYQRGKLIGEPISLIFDQNNSPYRHTYTDILRLGKYVETIGRRSDNTEFPMEITVTEVVREKTPFYTAMFRDITQRKELINSLGRST